MSEADIRASLATEEEEAELLSVPVAEVIREAREDALAGRPPRFELGKIGNDD